MRVGMLTLNLSIKDDLKTVSKTKIKNCWSMIVQGDYIVQKLHSKFNIHKNCV